MKQYRHKITGDVWFEQDNDGLFYYSTAMTLPKRYIENSCDWEEIEPVLFTTEDGVDIFEKDRILGTEVWSVTSYKNGGRVDWKNPHPYKNVKYFRCKEKAKQYILENKPVLSLKDVASCITRQVQAGTWKELGVIFDYEKLEELVKSKV